MQPDAPPATRPMFSVGPKTMGSSWALVGFALALVGVVVEELPSVLFYVDGAFTLGIAAYAQLQTELAITGFLLIGVGLFFLLRELERRLSNPPSYMRYTPIVVLVGALYEVATGLVYLAVLPALYSGTNPFPWPEAVFVAFSVGDWIARLAMATGVLMAIFGAVRTLVARPASAISPPSA